MKKLIPMVLSLLLIALLTGCDRADYKKAVSFYESGKYEEAAEIFEALGEYEDAPAMVTVCNYQIALGLVNQGNYQEARTIFLSLGDYEDSVQQSVSCACQLAEAYAQDGKLTEAVALLADNYSNPQAKETFFTLFAEEVTNVYLENFQAALDSWNEYVPIWLKAVKASGDKTPVGGTVSIPKVDQSAPQVIALQRSMEKANKSVAKLREAYREEILQVCEEDMRNLIDTFFTSADTIDQQFQNLDNWAVSLLFFGLQDNNAAKANNKLMNALYNVQDMLDILMSNSG